MNKREFLKTSMVLGAGALMSAPLVSSCATGSAKAGALIPSLIPMGEEGFEQKDLPYAFDALEPYIDAQTMELHYGKHHAGYTRKFNAALAEAGISGEKIEDIFGRVSELSAGIRNNGGGYYNHALFWNFMSPEGGGEPSGKLASAIDGEFGSFDQFKELFAGAAATQFGSGWAWLIVNEEGKLQVINSPNQDNPLMDISPVKGKPVLNLDVWEHAYYLKYQNKRTDYIANFWNVVDWDFVGKVYEEAIG